LLVCLLAGFFSGYGFVAFLVALLLPVVLMSIKQKSLSLGFYAVVAWCFHAAALPLGFFGSRQPPDRWIESKLLKSQ